MLKDFGKHKTNLLLTNIVNIICIYIVLILNHFGPFVVLCKHLVVANIIAVKKGEENSDKTQALINALKTDKVKKYIEDTYKGAVIAIF